MLPSLFVLFSLLRSIALNALKDQNRKNKDFNTHGKNTEIGAIKTTQLVKKIEIGEMKTGIISCNSFKTRAWALKVFVPSLSPFNLILNAVVPGDLCVEFPWLQYYVSIVAIDSGWMPRFLVARGLSWRP